MTLQEALNSGRGFRKVGTADPYGIPATFGAADVLADYELSPEREIVVTETMLARAWDAAVPASGSVAIAAESAMFKRLVRNLIG